MPRRPPPTSLRLVPGPLPTRNTPKHPLPSVPRPILLAPALYSRRSSPCLRQKFSAEALPLLEKATQGLQSFHAVSPAPTPVRQAASPEVPRGPWDHSGSIPLPFDVETLITPLKPVALRS